MLAFSHVAIDVPSGDDHQMHRPTVAKWCVGLASLLTIWVTWRACFHDADNGIQDAYLRGHNAGESEAYRAGKAEGFAEGYRSGKSDGLDKGREEGKQEGCDEARSIVRRESGGDRFADEIRRRCY